MNGDAHARDRLAHLVDRSQQLIGHAIITDDVPTPRALDGPARWQAMLEVMDRGISVETRQRNVEQDYGIDL